LADGIEIAGGDRVLFPVYCIDGHDFVVAQNGLCIEKTTGKQLINRLRKEGHRS
jgi:hypothetical protein